MFTRYMGLKNRTFNLVDSLKTCVLLFLPRILSIFVSLWYLPVEYFAIYVIHEWIFIAGEFVYSFVSAIYDEKLLSENSRKLVLLLLSREIVIKLQANIYGSDSD